MLKDRDVLLAKKNAQASREAAEASYQIRLRLKQVKELIARMGEIVKNEEKKASKMKGAKLQEFSDKLKEKKEIYELCQKHYEECENMEKRRFADKMPDSDRQNLLNDANVLVRKSERSNNIGKH